MKWEAIAGLLGMLGVLSGILLGWVGRVKSDRQESVQQASAAAALRADVDYIKRGVDSINDGVRTQGLRIDALTERMVRVEESSKQAHKRIDRLDRSKEGEE